MTRETEWTPDDVALLMAQHELESEIGPHGQPMSEATSGDMDPMAPGEHKYEAYYTRDYAAIELANGPKRLKRQLGEDTDISDLVWGVRKVKKTPIEEPRG